jgi:bifunctional NMN adenylyltransferase/nudix hydrolase
MDDVCKNHKKVVLFLGVAEDPDPEVDPLDFATRKIMIQNDYPSIIILPLKNNRSDIKWSKNIDELINMSFGGSKALLYGSRDSFIPHYFGKNQTVELITDTNFSGTQVRKEIRRDVLGSSDYRAGVITGKGDRKPTAFNTVHIACVNSNNELLLTKQKDIDKWQFIGDFIDPKDESKELSVNRIFNDETNGCEISDLKYVCSQKLDDYRYRRSKDSLMTTLFSGTFLWGGVKSKDEDIELEWFSITELKNLTELGIEKLIISEHIPLMDKFLNQ